MLAAPAADGVLCYLPPKQINPSQVLGAKFSNCSSIATIGTLESILRYIVFTTTTPVTWQLLGWKDAFCGISAWGGSQKFVMTTALQCL